MKSNSIIETILSSKCGHLNKKLREVSQKKRKSKFGNNKTEIDGIKFDSQREANYYKKLKILLKAGKIGLLELQKEYELNPGGTYSFKYVADFVFLDSETGETKVVDVKGFKTSVYKKKKRLMLKVHGIKIKET